MSANLYSHFEARFQKATEATAFVADSQETTYGELHRQVCQMANVLADLNIRPGDRVMVQVGKSIPNVVLYLATLKAGAVYNPLNTAYTAAELDYFMSDAEPGLFVVDSGKSDAIDIAKQKGIPTHTMEADGSGSLLDLCKSASDEHTTIERVDKDIAALLYTSGTTGRSKGAMITHENLSSNALTLHGYWGFEPGDVLLHALPVFHVHGLFVALNTAFLNTSKILWHARFDVDAVVADLPNATVMMGVPTFYTRLLADDRLDRAATAKLRLFVSGSAPLLAETHEEFEQRTGHKILERYGMTEAGMITSNPYDGERLAGTVGYALPGIDVRIADEAGCVLPAGDIGILEVKGPNVFEGYWRMPEKTQEEFRPDGYFISGDLATKSHDGRIAIVGRAKDLIISGGYNVYPKEIEEEINDLPGIDECAVVGVPHPDFGEGVIAIVKTSDPSSELDETSIIGALNGRLAKFKIPKHVFTITELPRNAMGKVQKADLRDTYKDLFFKEHV